MTGPPVTVVTGAGRGIGAAVVRRLSADGWAVIAVDRCTDDPGVPYPLAYARQLAALAESLPKVHAVQAGVRDGAAIAWACSSAAAALTVSALHADGGFAG